MSIFPQFPEPAYFGSPEPPANERAWQAEQWWVRHPNIRTAAIWPRLDPHSIPGNFFNPYAPRNFPGGFKPVAPFDYLSGDDDGYRAGFSNGKFSGATSPEFSRRPWNPTPWWQQFMGSAPPPSPPSPPPQTPFREPGNPTPEALRENQPQSGPFQQMHDARNPPSQTNNTQGYQPSAPQTAHSGVGADTFWTTPKPTPWVDQEYGDDLKKRMGGLSPDVVRPEDLEEALRTLQQHSNGRPLSEVYGMSDEDIKNAILSRMHSSAAKGFQDGEYVSPRDENVFAPTWEKDANGRYQSMVDPNTGIPIGRRGAHHSAYGADKNERLLDAQDTASAIEDAAKTNLNWSEDQYAQARKRLADLEATNASDLLGAQKTLSMAEDAANNAYVAYEDTLKELVDPNGPYNPNSPKNVASRAHAAMEGGGRIDADLRDLAGVHRIPQRAKAVRQAYKDKMAVDRTNRKGRQEAKDAQVRYDRTNRRAAMVRDEEEKARLRKARGRVSGQSHSSGQSMAESVRRKPQRRLFGQ